MVEKKALKIGVAVLAGVALVIGLSVGLTQNKNTATNAMSASNGMGVTSYNFETDCVDVLVSSSSSKAAKSGSISAKAAKSGTTVSEKSSVRRLQGKSSSISTKSAKSEGSMGTKAGKAAEPALVSVSLAPYVPIILFRCRNLISPRTRTHTHTPFNTIFISSPHVSHGRSSHTNAVL